MTSDRLWWQDGVVYQIYPRSYMDTNADGIGDLQGIRQRLDHLAWLGVDAIWLSPCFPSPMADFGYDVADYCDIDPCFGTLADFDELLADAHARDIRILLDWVPNHTSDQHAWFRQSRKSRDDPKRDWYVWRDAKPGGAPPNNWASVFGGPAWEWDEATGQFYEHTFLVEQPELNWRNPEVVQAMHDVLRFWLDRGVDGFRIDVIHALAKDPAFRDNPLLPGAVDFRSQQHVHDQNHPDVHGILRGIRRVLDAYDERMAVGEVYILDPNEVGKYYGDGDELHLAFNFSLMRAPWSAERFREEIATFENAVPKTGWPDVVLSSHDASRHASRYEKGESREEGERRARLAAMMLLTLRGTPFLYYGEEIGMRDVPIPPDRLQDPLAHTLHPKLSRDPERTPMQWEPGEGAGFTTGSPWLPIAKDADRSCVAVQREDPASLLHLYRHLMALRRRTPALHRGDYRPLPAPEGVLAYERSWRDSRALVALDFAGKGAQLALGEGRVGGGLSTRHGAALPESSEAFELAPGEGVVVIIA